jgi:hypothetical protein
MGRTKAGDGTLSSARLRCLHAPLYLTPLFLRQRQSGLIWTGPDQPEDLRAAVQARVPHYSALECACIEGRRSQISRRKVGASKRAAHELTAPEIGATQIGCREVTLHKVAPVERGEVKIRIPKGDGLQFGPPHIQPWERQTFERHVVEQGPKNARPEFFVIMTWWAGDRRKRTADDVDSRGQNGDALAVTRSHLVGNRAIVLMAVASWCGCVPATEHATGVKEPTARSRAYLQSRRKTGT